LDREGNTLTMVPIYAHKHVVLPEEIDTLGHVNNLNYLKWMIAAAVGHSAANGWPTQRYREIQAAFVVRSHRVEYLQPAFVGEEVVVRTWVAALNKVTCLRKYKAIRANDGVVLATGETGWVFLGLKPYQPRRIPPELLSAFVLIPPADEP
jgi:acyl-CoA thioester hydrolase